MRVLVHIDATAGWGKTKKIEEEIRGYAESSPLWNTRKALYITFTRRNVKGARKRLSSYVSPSNVRTLHSYCYSFLSSKKPLLDGKYLREFSSAFGYEELSSGAFFKPRNRSDRILSLYYEMRNLMFGEEEFLKRRGERLREEGITCEEFLLFRGRWEGFKRERGLIDYADILELSSPSFDGVYLAVDEAQDLTPLMWDALERLIANSPSLKRVVVIGDCDQTIYSFHGSSPGDFLERPGKIAERYGFAYEKLNTRNVSRRVPSRPLAFALKFLEGVNERDSEKEILPAREGGVVVFRGREDFLRDVPGYLSRGRSVVIQERHRHELRWWEARLAEMNIPYCFGYDDNYRKFLAYRNLSEGKGKKHLHLWTMFRDSVLKGVPYELYLQRWEEYCRRFEEEKEKWFSADSFLRNLALGPYRLPAILTTMHSQKGEEGDVVFVSGKWTRRVKPGNDERRLYFTACTRTKGVLVIDREGFGNIRKLLGAG